jgi:hypothetical protein
MKHFKFTLFLNTLTVFLTISLFALSLTAQKNLEPNGPGGLNQNSINLNNSNEQQQYAKALVKEVEDGQKFLSKLSKVDSALMLPVGISKKIGAVRYTIAIDSMKYKPNGAYLSAYASVKFPGSLDELAFGATNVLFNPEGVMGGNQAKLYLISTHTIQINSSVKLVVPGDGSSWVNWNCSGFNRIHMKGKFVFNSEKFSPGENSTSDTSVTATFEFEGASMQDFICQVSITPFRIKGIKDVLFEVTNATVDYSETANAGNMMFPQGYDNPNLYETIAGPIAAEESETLGGNSSMLSSGSVYKPELWTGFFLQNLTVYLPEALNKSNNRANIQANNLLIDNMGFTGHLSANNVFSTSEGSMSGWGFSVNQIGLSFVCNHLTGGNLNGQIAIPVSEVDELDYAAVVTENPVTKELDYGFTISPKNNINFDVLGATIHIDNNSSISVEKTSGKKLKPTAVLNGYIGFNLPKFNSGQGRVLFQGLTISTQAPYVTAGLFGLSVTNGASIKCKNFALTLNNLMLGVQNNKPKLTVGVGVKLSDVSGYNIGIETTIHILGRIAPTTNPKFASIGKLEFESISVSGININFSGGPFTISGGISLYDNDPVYGDGFAGGIFVSIPDVISGQVGAKVIFGNTGTYKYYLVDVKVPGPFPIPSTPVIITEVVGGIFYHMQPNKTTKEDFIALTANYGNAINSQISYVPNSSIPFGIKFGASMITSGASAFKASAMLSLAFNNSGGLSILNFKCNASAIAGNIPINGNGEINYDFPTNNLDGLFVVTATSHLVISGTAALKIHSDPNDWHVCLGTPTMPINISVLGKQLAGAYLMVGTSLPMPAGVPNNRDPAVLTALGQGNGMCLGSWLEGDFNGNIGWNSIFSVGYDFDVNIGADAMMRNYGNNAYCANGGSAFGINRNYLKGNGHFSLSGALRIHGNFKFPPRCPRTLIPCLFNESFDRIIFSVSSGTLNLNVELPNPLYFEIGFNKDYNIFDGKLEGNVSFTYKYGNRCETP